MKRTTFMLAGLAFTSTAVFSADKKPGELTDPMEILRKVDAAAKAVKTVKYDVTLDATGAMAARGGKGSASFIVSGYVDGAPEKFMADAKFTPSGSTDVLHVSGGSDADLYFVVDHRGKIAYEDIDPAVIGNAGRLFQQASMVEFVHSTPFSDELNGRSQKLIGSANIAGEDCYEIHVQYENTRAPEATWCFSKKDFLPRRRIDHRTLQNGDKGTMVKTITKLVVDPKITAETFKLKLPEGYKKTDEFAPDFLSR